jgi:hypothetical protein
MKKIGLLLIVVVLFFSACKKENNVPIESQTFEVKSTSSTTWKYFSFASNDTVVVTNPENSTAWDLAFQRYRVKTNSGLSGNGMGGAANSYMKGQSGFDALSTVPDTSTFVVDEKISVAVVMGYQDYIVNPLLYTWFSLEFSAQGTQILPTDYVYIVKTSTGKYAKVWFKSYYSATNQSGYVTFQYKYQPDGSKNLE